MHCATKWLPANARSKLFLHSHIAWECEFRFLRHLCNESLLSSQGLICIWFSKECWLIPVLGLLWGALALLSGVMELLSGLLCLPWAVLQMRHWNVDAMRFRHCVHQRV